MPIPVPPHYDIDADPLVHISVNEDWHSVLQGIFVESLDPDIWEGDDSDFVNIQQAILEIMILGVEAEGETMEMKVGGYTGDGTGSNAITGVGFAPNVVVVYGNSDDGDENGLCIRHSSDSNCFSIGGDNVLMDNRDNIVSLDADGFTVDEDASGNGYFNINVNAKTYSYICLQI